MRAQTARPTAMAFYNPNGFVPAFKHAMAFAGKGGRVATMPDIIDARLATKPGDLPWEIYFTTMSAEYVGYSKGGNPIAIVAHGVGPMSTLDGVLATYGNEFKDKNRNRCGGRISTEEFHKLENGHYGFVHVIDIEATWKRRTYQFSGHAISAKEITEEPLWQARLGKSWQAYVEYHTKFAHEYHRKRNTGPYKNPCILGMEDANNCPYSERDFLDGMLSRTPGTALAHLLSIGQLTNSSHQYYEYDYALRENRTSLSNDVSCHEWSNGTRLLGVRPGATTNIHPGLPCYHDLVKHQLKKLWCQNEGGVKKMGSGFWHLVQIGVKFFTDYQKKGEGLDLCEPEFLVTKIHEMPNGPVKFRTTVGGYHGFFKYGINEVSRIAPLGANAYTVGEIEIEWNDGNPTHHIANITFYRIEVDTTRRLIRMDDIYSDFKKIQELTC